MKWNIVIHSLAEWDLTEVSLWYESKTRGLGKDFLEEIDKALSKLARAPETYPVYYKNFRRVMTNRFPYKLFFQIERNRVVVFRVLHAKRNHLLFFKKS